jgi:hypothetical protein
MLSSYLHVGLPIGLLPSGLPIKMKLELTAKIEQGDLTIKLAKIIAQG